MFNHSFKKLYFLVQELEVLAIDIARYDTAGNKFQEKINQEGVVIYERR